MRRCVNAVRRLPSGMPLLEMVAVVVVVVLVLVLVLLLELGLIDGGELP